MDKEKSTIIKGIAILMMLFYHLFGISELNEMCSPWIYINGRALVFYLSDACYPVPFFLILSGYGLTYVYRKQQLKVRHQLKRLLKLYIHYWIVLLIFVSFGHFIHPEVYPNDLPHIIGNITAIRCNYNGEVWFLFPYALLSLSSVFLIPFIDQLRTKLSVITAVIVYAALFVMAKYFAPYIPENIILNTIGLQIYFYVILLFYFVLGIVLFRLLENTERIHKLNGKLCVALLITLVILKSMFKVTIADGIYAFLFIILFLNIHVPEWLQKIFKALGRRSMLMWMTHTFFCVYLFQDFIYGFKYPLIIFLVLVVVSYLTAIPIMWLSSIVIKKLKLN